MQQFRFLLDHLTSAPRVRRTFGALVACGAAAAAALACGDGGSSGGLGGFIAAIESGIDAQCTCQQIAAADCSAAKQNVRSCVEGAAEGETVPSCAAQVVRDYVACLRRDGQCDPARGLENANCDAQFEAAKMGCDLQQEVIACVEGGESSDPNQDPANPNQGPGDPNQDGQLCSDTCPFAGDGECDDGGPNAMYVNCGLGTDCTDCGPRDPTPNTETPPGGAGLCSNTCRYAGDNECDDNGPDARTSACSYGTDCLDCGPR